MHALGCRKGERCCVKRLVFVRVLYLLAVWLLMHFQEQPDVLDSGTIKFDARRYCTPSIMHCKNCM